MKQKLIRTKVTVRLRKSEYRKEWYIYLESYPVIVPGKEEVQRIREYLNRTVATVEFDKKRVAKRTENSISFKPKRDDNGVIICKSDLDKETMFYADSVRKIRQREYDKKNIYNEVDLLQETMNEKKQENFVDYFKSLIKRRHKNSSDSIKVNWERSLEFLKSCGDDFIPFGKIDMKFCENYKTFLLSAPLGGNKKGTLSQNSAATYFSIFKAALKQAFIDEYFLTDISAKLKGISEIESRREYLTIDELNTLVETHCNYEVVKRAALFSALTGLRLSDIQKLKWEEITIENDSPRIHFTQQKTKGVEYMPISAQALQLCGKRKSPTTLVFSGLPDSAWISRPLKKWITTAGITKKITFHNFRHTFATLQLSSGTDIYTVSKMLGHTNVRTTQVYAKVVDEKKNQAAEAIQLKTLKN